MHVIREWFHILLENTIYFENGLNLKLSTIFLTELRWSREWCSPLHGGRINADWHSRTLLRTDYRGWNLTSISHDWSKQGEIHYSPSKHVFVSVPDERKSFFWDFVRLPYDKKKYCIFSVSLNSAWSPYDLHVDYGLL